MDRRLSLFVWKKVIVSSLWWSYTCNTFLQLLFTVKPFNLAALKVGDLACKIILAPLILAN